MNLEMYSHLVSEINRKRRENLASGLPVIISVDGLSGVGKSTLARKLVREIDAVHIALDDYLTPHQGSYLEYLDYTRIETDLSQARTRSPSGIIIDGVCALAVCIRIKLEPDIKVYMRRVDESGQWEDEHLYSEENNLDEVLRYLDRLEAIFPNKPGITDSDREFARYHIEMKPISNADFVLDIPKMIPPPAPA